MKALGSYLNEASRLALRERRIILARYEGRWKLAVESEGAVGRTLSLTLEIAITGEITSECCSLPKATPSWLRFSYRKHTPAFPAQGEI